MTLYFVIFGNLIGSRIGQMHGVCYMEFIVPGLIMMSVITNSYSNRITSYNVCYTKLLRYGQIGGGHQPDLLTQCLQGWAAPNQLPLAPACLLHQFAGQGALLLAGRLQGADQRHVAQGRRRITSYNVCYTKLLRIDRGQYEAAQVLGLGKWHTTTRVVLPQMFRIALPAVANESITLVKDTALLYAVV